MLQKIITSDQQLFSFLNSLHNPFIDVVMEFISGRFTWIPLYLLLIWLLLKYFKKQFWLLLLSVIIVVATADLVSVHCFKNVFERLRPCHFLENVHIVNNHCGGKYGFVSSHAANVFGLATFFFLLLRKQLKWVGYVMLAWAVVVVYSRIYLGVHFPLDIFCGAVLGSLIGYLGFKAYQLISNKIYN